MSQGRAYPFARAGCPVSMIHSNSIWWFRLPYSGIQTYFYMKVNPIFLWLVFSERQSKELKQNVHPNWNQTAQVPRSFIGRGNAYLILLKNWLILVWTIGGFSPRIIHRFNAFLAPRKTRTTKIIYLNCASQYGSWEGTSFAVNSTFRIEKSAFRAEKPTEKIPFQHPFLLTVGIRPLFC
jgi:hypothetical protein